MSMVCRINLYGHTAGWSWTMLDTADARVIASGHCTTHGEATESAKAAADLHYARTLSTRWEQFDYVPTMPLTALPATTPPSEGGQA